MICNNCTIFYDMEYFEEEVENECCVICKKSDFTPYL